ncbi:MAG: NYN domain-containing protein [Actinomycetota bacterium]
MGRSRTRSKNKRKTSNPNGNGSAFRFRIPIEEPDASHEAPEEIGLNGFDLPDWLVEPLYEVAVVGLEFMQRNEVPARLVPLIGRRARKLKKAERETILAALGHHERFTALTFQFFREAHRECMEPYEDTLVEEIIEDLDAGEEDPSHVVSLLIAHGRIDDARAVTKWIEDEPLPSDLLETVVGELARDQRETLSRLDATDRELSAERKAAKRLKRRADKAAAVERSHREKHREAERRATEAERKLAEATAGSETLQRRISALEAEVEAGRRERRDLLAELQALQARFSRARRELKLTRAKVPKELEPPRPKRRRPAPPPSAGDLRRRYLAGGAREVLRQKRILVLVDGYNVGLGHIRTEKVADKRRRLETALESYRARTKNPVMVVYDGAKVAWFYVPTAGRRDITRVFTTDGETADDYLVAELEAGTNGHAPVVVTSDRELRERCIALGAFAISSGELVDCLTL